MTLSIINNLEAQLIASGKGSDSTLFTDLIYQSRIWIDEFKTANLKEIHISPYKVELDKQVDMVAYYIECGYTTDEAIRLIGHNRTDFNSKLTTTHTHIIQAARKQRKINKEKNYKPNK